MREFKFQSFSDQLYYFSFLSITYLYLSRHRQFSALAQLLRDKGYQ